MNKLSAAQMLQVIATVPEHLRKLSHSVQELSEENRDLKAKLASKEEFERASDIVSKMEAHGQHLDGDTPQEKVAHLMADGPNLDVLEQAVDMMAPNGSLVDLGDAPGNGVSDLEAYVLGDIS